MMAYLPNIYFIFLQNWDRGCIKYVHNAAVSGALDNLNGPCQQVSTMLYTIGSILVANHCCGFGKEELSSTNIHVLPLVTVSTPVWRTTAVKQKTYTRFFPQHLMLVKTICVYLTILWPKKESMWANKVVFSLSNFPTAALTQLWRMVVHLQLWFLQSCGVFLYIWKVLASSSRLRIQQDFWPTLDFFSFLPSLTVVKEHLATCCLEVIFWKYWVIWNNIVVWAVCWQLW